MAGVDLRMVVPVEIGPDGTVAVDVFVAHAVAQNGSTWPETMTGGSWPGRAPVPHLGKRMPLMGAGRRSSQGAGLAFAGPALSCRRRVARGGTSEFAGVAADVPKACGRWPAHPRNWRGGAGTCGRSGRGGFPGRVRVGSGRGRSSRGSSLELGLDFPFPGELDPAHLPFFALFGGFAPDVFDGHGRKVKVERQKAEVRL